jgi:hypothetical protein
LVSSQPPARTTALPTSCRLRSGQVGSQKYEDFRKNNSWYGPRRLVTRIVIIITMGHEKWSYWLFLYYIIWSVDDFTNCEFFWFALCCLWF